MANSSCLEDFDIHLILLRATEENSYEAARQTCVDIDSTLAVLDTEEKFNETREFVTQNELLIRENLNELISGVFFGLKKS